MEGAFLPYPLRSLSSNTYGVGPDLRLQGQAGAGQVTCPLLPSLRS